MKLSTLTLLSMKNKKVGLSLGVSNVIDIAEVLFAFLIKLFPNLMQRYFEYKIEKNELEFGTLISKDENSRPNRG